MKWKPQPEQVRIVYTDAVERVGDIMFPDDKGKTFAIIGPFDGHMDKLELQSMLLTLLRGWNVQPQEKK